MVSVASKIIINVIVIKETCKKELSIPIINLLLKKNVMIVITGAAGFIGSVIVERFNDKKFEDLILVDDFSNTNKNRNLAEKKYVKKVHRDDFFHWFDDNYQDVDFVIHIGARTDTTEFNMDVLNALNLDYTKQMWVRCSEYEVPLIYASSAATYGMGEYGYMDNHDVIYNLKPLNPYGISKNEFDKWAIKEKEAPPFWVGLKFFNVYGPNEYHKGRMASVILHAYNQIKLTGKVKLFKSHNSKFNDGEQLRDFVYVMDVADVIMFLMETKPKSGLYNLGTGTARTFIDLAISTFKAMDIKPDIDFIDTPEDIRDKYQYFTEANMEKLKGVGFKKAFTSLEDGINDYVQKYLTQEKYF